MPDYKILEIHLKMLDNVHGTSIYIVLRNITVPVLAMEKNVFKENDFLNITSEAEPEAKGERALLIPGQGRMCLFADEQTEAGVRTRLANHLSIHKAECQWQWASTEQPA